MIELIQRPDLIYAAVRAIGPYSSVAGPAFGRVTGWAGQAGLFERGGEVIGLSWDDPDTVPAEKLRYDAAVTLDRAMELPEGIQLGALPAMTWAAVRHVGDFAGMGATFRALARELRTRRDLCVVDLCGLEVYPPPAGVPPDKYEMLCALPVVRVPQG